MEPSENVPEIDARERDADSADPAREPTRSRPIRWWLCLLIGAAAAGLGLLPWLVTGMRLPLQNLWATADLPDAYPLVLLPFSQYFLSTIAALLIVGAAFAGIAGRATRARQRRFGVAWMLVGLLIVHVAAIVQTTLVVRDGLQDRVESDLYLAALVGIAVLANLIGVLVMLLVAAAPRGGAVIGLAIAAVLSSAWLGLLLIPEPAFAGPAAEPALFVLRWLPAVLVGAAIGWAGVGTAGRAVASVVALLILWVGPALITAVSYAAGSRVLLRRPDELLDAAAEVFRSAVTMPEVVVPPLVVAVVVAVIGIVARALVRRGRATGPSSGAASAEATADGAPATSVTDPTPTD
ncbi:hypothetical protein [Agromyces sp. GXS1127]|uniref:hypothetical protein n=1 Tax=Agromyces sp. GXS1127 TaxID=3424181 RepID=UPI003D313130